MSGASPTGKPDADAPVPPEGTEQAADQASKQQQPPESSVMDTVTNVLDGVDAIGSVLDIFG
jgi:hypothetical protein